MRTADISLILALLTAVSACGEGATPVNVDAGLGVEASAPDGAQDATSPDDGASVPLAGFGVISGQCGALTTADLTSPTPVDLQAVIDFGAVEYAPDHLGELSAGGQHIIADGNLGGSSLISEVFAYELLYRCELATLLKTEPEIVYVDANGKKTDLLVEIDGVKLGLSVTRAYVYPGTSSISVAQATTLLTDKLSDIVSSTANVSDGDAWVKQVLAVMAYGPEDAAAVAQAYLDLPAQVKGDSIVVITQTDGADAPIY